MRRVPAQRFDAELLDMPIHDLDLLAANFRDMATANRYLLGNRALWGQIARWLDLLPSDHTATILDVATGAADGPMVLLRRAEQHGRRVRLIAGDRDDTGLRLGMWGTTSLNLVQHDALRLPFADRTIDIVTCSFALHHFAPDTAVDLLRELARVARVGVVVSDLRRCWGAYWGARLLALGSGNELTRHDGPLSALRAYTPDEALALLEVAGTGGTVHAEPIFRLSLVIHTTSDQHTRGFPAFEFDPPAAAVAVK